MKRLLVPAAAFVAVFLVVPAAQAHPLGNFTINTYDGLRVAPDRLQIDHVIDMAEIPAFQKRGAIDLDSDGVISPSESTTYAAATCAAVARDLTVQVDARALALAVRQSAVAFPRGAGGLTTMRVECSLEGRTAAPPQAVLFADPTFAEHIGWREITAVGDRMTLVGARTPTRSVSARLTRYPQDLLRSPLDMRRVSFTVTPGGPAAPAPGQDPSHVQARGVDGLTRAFTALVASHRASVPFGVLAVFIAIALGALHALAPGHGKTVMAAYVVGRRGSFRQAVLIGATVSVTHTIGVVLIGLALTASRALAPERIYPWLGFASGLLLIGIGAAMVRARLRGRRHLLHPHEHADETQLVGRRGLIAIGFAGGLVPSPSALVVLLGAIALGRMWFGVILIAAYGSGMGAMLAGAGLLLVRLRGRLDRAHTSGWAARSAAVVPVVAASIVLLLGVATAARGLAQLR